MAKKEADNKSQISVESAYSQACGHLKDGRYSEADRLCTAIIQAIPNHVDAINLLGVIAQKVNRHDLAAQQFQRAIDLDGSRAMLFFNLGTALFNLGRRDEAVQVLRGALEKNPGNSQLSEFLKYILKTPAPDAIHGDLQRGIALHQSGKLDEATCWYRKVLAVEPGHVVTLSNLGAVLLTQGKLAEAIAILNEAISSQPDYVEAHVNLGNAMAAKGELGAAITSYQQAIAIKPDYEDAFSNLGNVLVYQGRLVEAVASFRQAIAIRPDHAEALNNLGVALKELGKPDEAVVCLKSAIALKGDYADAFNNLGNALVEQGEFAEGIKNFRHAVALRPSYVNAYSNLIFALPYIHGITAEEILLETKMWDKQFASSEPVVDHANIPDPEKRLRIGYVSPDFRDHAVAYLLEPLIAAHNHDIVEIFCYAEVLAVDQVTERFMALADHWRSTVGIRDVDLLEEIAKDKIDVLIDCGGHTSESRLALFSHKPAPVQISYLCMHGTTTGLSAMDYALSNSKVVPPGFEKQLSEKVLLIPGTDIVFQPKPDWPLPVKSSVGSTTAPLFACVGDPLRIDSATISLWQRLLEAIPGSKIIFKHKKYNSESGRKHWQKFFRELGDRAEFEDVTGGWGQHNSFYGRVDLVLDTLPLTGTLTVLIPLWMGVPVVTMRGAYSGHRYGSAVVENAGFPELVADSQEEYLGIINGLVKNRQRLDLLSNSLRDSVATSPVCDSRNLAMNIENAYRKVWRVWCEKHQSG
ncbi:MAG: tetratricopeptide repeat protein [Magnetococcales bacterium]|nr:tetratricopeptide repeat protein [Magnetococcales bacterium]